MLDSQKVLLILYQPSMYSFGLCIASIVIEKISKNTVKTLR